MPLFETANPHKIFFATTNCLEVELDKTIIETNEEDEYREMEPREKRWEVAQQTHHHNFQQLSKKSRSASSIPTPNMVIIY